MFGIFGKKEQRFVSNLRPESCRKMSSRRSKLTHEITWHIYKIYSFIFIVKRLFLAIFQATIVVIHTREISLSECEELFLFQLTEICSRL